MKYRYRTFSLTVLSCLLVSGCNTLSASKAPQQTAEYFNCSTPTGCKPITSKAPSNDNTATKYPIVLVHGLIGFNNLFGKLDYFNGIPEALLEGGSQVYVTKTSSVNNAELRGEQLLQQIYFITAVTGKEKVNLIGHSLGGIDIRYVAANAPDRVASVTAVASPEQGSKMADWVMDNLTKKSPNSQSTEISAKALQKPIEPITHQQSELQQKDFEQANSQQTTLQPHAEQQSFAYQSQQPEFTTSGKAAVVFFQFVGNFMERGAGIDKAHWQPQDAYVATEGLTTDYMANYFNPKYPAAMPGRYCGHPPKNNVINGVAYYSFSGVGTITNKLDMSDYMLALTSKAFDKNDANDGLVSACSSRIGYVIRDNYKMNHLDSINQVLGLTAADETDTITVYRNQVNRLKNQGF